MKKLALISICLLLLSCSTEKEQMETVRDLAKQDLMIQLNLPEGTSFNDKEIVVTEGTELEGIGSTYIVKVTISSEDSNGNTIKKTHTLEYSKIAEGGLSPEDYELKSFD